MEFEIEPYKVYIKTDSDNRITAINSSAFISNFEDWIEIDSGYGDKYHHAQGNYFDKPIMDAGGTHNYKYEDNAVRECTDEEKEAEKATFPQPAVTSEERITQLESQLEATQEVLDALLMGDIEL